jgi:hypothetical protein
MSSKFSSAIATMGIDIGRNSFHIIRLALRASSFPDASVRKEPQP